LFGLHTGGYGGPGGDPEGNEMPDGNQHDSNPSSEATESFNKYWDNQNRKDAAAQRASFAMKILKFFNPNIKAINDKDGMKTLGNQSMDAWNKMIENCRDEAVDRMANATTDSERQAAKDEYDGCDQ